MLTICITIAPFNIDWLANFEGEQFWLVCFNLTKTWRNLIKLVKTLLAAFNYDQLQYLKRFLKCEMWKCSACAKHNETMQTTAEFVSILNCKHFLKVSNFSDLSDSIWFNLKTPEFFFLLDYQQVFHKAFFGWKSLFHFFVILVYYPFLQE